MSIVLVASAAGVSKATVSRVINGMPGVGADTAKMVREVMQQVGYEPPAVRRGPKLHSRRKQRHGSVALLVGGHDPSALYTLPVLPSLLNGIERALAEHDKGLVLTGLREDGRLPSALDDESLEGLLLFGDLESRLATGEKDRLAQFSVVWLLHEHSDALGSFDRVVYNNAKVGVLAAEHLLSRGHRRLAFVNTIPAHAMFVERQRVFAGAARAGGATVLELVSRGSGQPQMLAMHSLMREFAAEGPRPTGLFVPSDSQLMGLYMALQAAGISPGVDVEVIACDNERAVLDQLHPRPATIDINWNLVGRRGVQQLLWRRRHPEEKSRIGVVIDPVLVSAEQPEL